MEPALLYEFVTFLIDVRGCLYAFTRLEDTFSLCILWVGMGYGEEVILLVLYLVNYKPNIRVKIFGIDIDPVVIKYTLKTIKSFNLSSIVTYIELSILNVTVEFITSNNIKCIYTSAAFDTMISLYLYYLCVAGDCFMFCNINIIKNIKDLQTQLSDVNLNIPASSNSGNTAWYVVAKGSLYSSTTDETSCQRNIFIFNVNQLSDSDTLAHVQTCAIALFDQKRKALTKGTWAQRLVFRIFILLKYL